MIATPRSALAFVLLAGAALAPARAQDQTTDQGWGPQPGGDVVISLSQALDLAVAENLDLLGARQDAAASVAREKGPLGAFDPVFTFFYRHDKSVSPNVFAFNSAVVDQNSDTYRTSFSQLLPYGASWRFDASAGRTETNNASSRLSPAYTGDVLLTYTQPLLKGLGRDANRRLVQQALNAAVIANHQVLVQARTVARDTITAYWDLVFAREDLGVKRASLQLAEELLRKNRIMVEVGTLAPLEVTQAEAAVAQRKQDIIVAEVEVARAEDRLRALIGLPEDSAWWSSSLVPADHAEYQAAHASVAEARDAALTNRNELRIADLQVDNADLDVKAAKDAIRPQLDLELTWGSQGLSGVGDFIVDTDNDGVPDTTITLDEEIEAAMDQVTSHDFENYSVSLNYVQPILNRAAKADFNSARIELERRRTDVLSLRQDILLEVRDAVRNVTATREYIAAARATRTLSEKKLDAEQKKFENGLSTNFEVLQFQTDLADARSAELRSLVGYTKAVATLQAARGTLLADYGLSAAP